MVELYLFKIGGSGRMAPTYWAEVLTVGGQMVSGSRVWTIARGKEEIPTIQHEPLLQYSSLVTFYKDDMSPILRLHSAYGTEAAHITGKVNF
jgi:hypothetical protein